MISLIPRLLLVRELSAFSPHDSFHGVIARFLVGGVVEASVVACRNAVTLAGSDLGCLFKLPLCLFLSVLSFRSEKLAFQVYCDLQPSAKLHVIEVEVIQHYFALCAVATMHHHDATEHAGNMADSFLRYPTVGVDLVPPLLLRFEGPEVVEARTHLDARDVGPRPTKEDELIFV